MDKLININNKIIDLAQCRNWKGILTDRRMFLTEMALLAGAVGAVSCQQQQTQGRPRVKRTANPAPMVSFRPSGSPVIQRSASQLIREVRVIQMPLSRSSWLRQRSRRMTPRFITMHNTANPSAGAIQHAKAMNNGALRHDWHFTVDQSLAVQHLPLNETGKHADSGGPGDMYSIGIEMCEVHGESLARTFDRSAKLAAFLMYKFGIPLRNVVPHNYWTGKDCPRHLMDGGRQGGKWAWFISRVDYYRRCVKA